MCVVKWLEPVLMPTLQCVTLIFVPDKSEINGNERADSLISRVPVVKGMEMDRVDTLDAIGYH